MKILAIDTSGPVCGVAILVNGAVAYEAATVNKMTHSVNLLPMIDAACQAAGLTIADMDRIACVVGPGSFTGVRIGVSTVKGLAHAHGTACVAVVEWPSQCPEAIPETHLAIRLEPSGENEREITFEPMGDFREILFD